MPNAAPDKDHLHGKKNAKQLSEEALKTAMKRRKGKIYPFECTVSKKNKER